MYLFDCIQKDMLFIKLSLNTKINLKNTNLLEKNLLIKYNFNKCIKNILLT